MGGDASSSTRAFPAALPATVPLDHANWKLNAGSTPRPCVAIGHDVLRSANKRGGGGLVGGSTIDGLQLSPVRPPDRSRASAGVAPAGDDHGACWQVGE